MRALTETDGGEHQAIAHGSYHSSAATLRDVLIAVAAAVLALLWRQAMVKYLGHELPPYITFYPAMMLAAMLLGMWPAC